MKNIKNLCFAILALGLLATPAAAQKSQSNEGGAARADVRADQAQTKAKKDKDRDPSPDKDKKGKHKGETQGKHKANGHTH